MPTLKDILLDTDRRSQVVADCVHLVETEVQSKSGLSGMAVKGALTVVKAVKPGIIRDAVEHLLEPFVIRLDPFYQEFAAKDTSAPLEPFFVNRSFDIANALLGVTDERAQKTSHATLRKTYEKLRPTSQKHVEQAVPGIARLIARYVNN